MTSKTTSKTISNERFISIKKSDPQFKIFLWGRIDENKKALPIRSLNVGSEEEIITFEIKTDQEISKPGFFKFMSKVIKLKSFILILFPLYYVLCKNLAQDAFVDPISVSFAALALIFLFAGFNIRNDISDHISGFDRVNIPLSEKPILLGWSTAARLSKLSWILIGLGILLSVPVLILQAEEIKVVAISAVLLLVGNFFKHNSYKEKELGELILFLTLGTGVACGFQVAIGAAIDAQIVLFGTFWGALVLFLIHVNNFSHLLTSTQAGIKNSVTLLGFDKSKIFLLIWWATCLVLWFFVHFYKGSFLRAAVLTALMALLSWRLAIKLIRIQSPLGSDLILIRHVAYKTFLGLVSIFFIECTFWVGARFNWTI